MSKQALEIYVFGKACPLSLSHDPSLKGPELSFDGRSFVFKTPSTGQIDLEPHLKPILSKRLKPVLDQHIKSLQPEFKVKPKSVTIESSEVRWGSCNGKRELTFNWKLAMLPDFAIRYVVVHEMCHMSHLNHDRSFWRLVGKLDPNYKEAMALLGNTKRSE